MRVKSTSGGFTILETIITVTVSSAMLVTVVLLFSGRQQEVQFSQGTRLIEASLQDYINDTATGYFPQDNTSRCQATPSGPEVTSTGSNEQGTNLDCIFLGKALHFQRNQLSIYPVVGDRLRAESAIANATFASALPTIAPTLAETFYYPYGLELGAIHWDNTATNHLNDGALIVFASSPNGTGSASSAGFNPGIQRISAYASGNPAATQIGLSATTNAITSAIQNPALSWPSGGYVVLCFQDGPASSPGRRVRGIVISGGSREITASVQLSGMGYQCV